MTRRTLIFFPQVPFPPRSGAHLRCPEVLAALRELGHQVTFLCTTLVRDGVRRPGDVGAPPAGLAHRYVVYRPSPLDYAHAAALALPHLLRRRSPPVDSRAYSPPGLRRCFERLVEEADPEFILINYTFSDRLLDHHRHRQRVRVIDTQDLASVNFLMRQALGGHFQSVPLRLQAIPEALLDERFYEIRDFCPSPAEMRILDRYDHTLAVSVREAELVRAGAPHTRVSHVPVTQAVTLLDNRYDGPALFTAGPNPFNLQGFAYFVRRVLPGIRARQPAFALQVTGACCSRLPATPGVLLAGLVPSLRDYYARARFAICPVFGGTGQQVKIVEAMAHGLPVVALRAPARESPLRHEVNGLIADTAEQFAQHCSRLWEDPGLCRRLGAAARQSVAAECSPAVLRDHLDRILQPRNARVAAPARAPDALP